ncbi:MAG TPA: cyclic nucleotide-binding domain-containing protein [Planctomycetota bacterium]|nr:cyclic nucleotide-binding domain-containing protein [Planctomycetota bacterium]
MPGSVSKTARAYKKGEVIIQEGTPASEEIYYLDRGTLMAEVKGKVVGKIESGEFFGEIASILQTARSVTVRAATGCIVYIFKGLQDRGLYDLLKDDPKVMRKLFEQMALRLVESNHRHAGDAEKLTAIAHRFQTTISGALFALEKIRDKHKLPVLEELFNFVRLSSGIASGRPQDVNTTLFPTGKDLFA